MATCSTAQLPGRLSERIVLSWMPTRFSDSPARHEAISTTKKRQALLPSSSEKCGRFPGSN
jgi:hypothetical protein